MEALWNQQLGAAVEKLCSDRRPCSGWLKASMDIVLVNRILAQDGSSGLQVIRELIGTGTKTPVMLLSDRSDAQDAAVALGAVRGFGKATWASQATLDLVQRVAGGG